MRKKEEGIEFLLIAGKENNELMKGTRREDLSKKGLLNTFSHFINK